MTATTRPNRFSDLRVPIVTRREASILRQAIRVLGDIERRNAAAAWDRPSDEARSLGRVVGIADVAGDAVFAVLNNASAFADSPQAHNAIRTLRD